MSVIAGVAAAGSPRQSAPISLCKTTVSYTRPLNPMVVHIRREGYSPIPIGALPPPAVLRRPLRDGSASFFFVDRSL